MQFSETFDEIFTRFEPLCEGASTKETAELFYRKGMCDGKETVLREIRPLVMTPEDAAKLESKTISERINYAHLGEVIEAKKMVS